MTALSFCEDISGYLLPTFYATVTHPLTHARTLMQLGYEPMPKYLGHSVFSSIGLSAKVYKYPSIFTYCKYLRENVGIVGLFTTGLTSRIIYWHISSMVSDHILFKFSDGKLVTEARHLNTNKDFREYLYEVRNLTVARSVAVIISYPFQVLMVRQIAEIMNGDSSQPKYLFSLIPNILDDEGFLSLYNGLSSKLVGEIATIWLTAGFVFVVNKYIIKERVAPDVKEYSATIGGVICSDLTYRFNVISTMMAISGSKIKGALPLKSAFDCYTFLNDNRGFNRGSSLFLRYAN